MMAVGADRDMLKTMASVLGPSSPVEVGDSGLG